ncbi:serine/arginine repetitive matrix protein 2-like isoform X2 [Acanthaster planci]|uniref:Serine/arginine repetitive matrix protein 2-like isoform X2 n=1 Tax=Acanthaster planci TaxID=133434 RepID=A0A8B7Z6I2_ACAPL|nr:serine/arginine repetitive matrix protein 2-like isoform X2 [Acanthaster planci]
MAESVAQVGLPGAEKGDLPSCGMEEGSLVRSKDEWGSIIDILHSIENTTQPSKPAPSMPSPTARLATLSENIQTTEMASPMDGKQGQGLQQLDHLVRMMEQMCNLQKQNLRLREQAEYLNAIKDLQELRNESLMQNCKCEAQRRSSDIGRTPDETFSEPESTVGDEMDTKRDLSPTREKRASRSIKRETKTKGAKTRSRSLDPYRKDTTEPGEKDSDRDRERERGRPGIFSKFERMKEKLTTRRGSVKKHNTNKRADERQDEDLKANAFRPDPSSNEHFNLQMDGTETKSEDSGIYHVGPDEIVHLPRLTAEILPKSADDLSDSEDVFEALQPSWNQTNNFSMEARKGSDFSTGSSSEDYLELKPKRTAAQLPQDEPVTTSSPEQQRRRGDSEERAVKSSDEKEENGQRKMRFRRSASLQDNTSLNSDDEFDKPAKTSWEVKEAPAVLQRTDSGQKLLQHSPSNDFEFSDASLDMQTGQDSASTSSLESKAAQKRKYFRKSHHVDEPTSPTTEQRFKAVAFEMRSPKSSPPEKKRHKVGWEKVKHAVTRKHIGDISKTKGTISMDESILRSSEEPSSPTDSSPPEDASGGGKTGRAEVKKGDPKRDKERGTPPQTTSTEAQSPLALYESLQANLSEDFAKKMEKWDKKKQRHAMAGASPLEKAKQSSLDSCSSEAGTLPTSDLEAELQRGLTEDFYKKLAEWDKLKLQQRGGAGGGGIVGPNSPKAEAKQKQKGAKEGKKAAKSAKITSKEKDRDKHKTKDVQQRSKSPDASTTRKISPPSEAIYSTENITVFAKQGGKLKLEGATKEFSKKYKEWEKKEKKKKNFPPLRPEDIATPVFDQAQALTGNFREDATPPTPASPTMITEPTSPESGDLYVIAHATPVIVEPDFDSGDPRLARAGEPIFRTQSAPPASTAASQSLDAAPRGERPSSQRVPSVEEDVFTLGACASPPIPQERVNRLEQRNSFLAEQLKMEDVNLQAVQEEIVNMDEQIAEISGEKPEDHTQRRVSTCSSIGESALEAELSDIKMQIALLEENLKKRPRHKGHHRTEELDGVKGQDSAGSLPEVDGKCGISTEAADFTQYPPPAVEAEKTILEEPPSGPVETSTKADGNSNLAEALEKSLQEREAIIKLLQARVERQAQEINYLKNGVDAANQFRRAKSFTARDKKIFDPRAMKIVDIPIDKPEASKVKMLSDEQSESSKSLKSDSTPSLDTLHISAEDIRMDESTEKKQDKVEPGKDKKSDMHPSQLVEKEDANTSEISKMESVDKMPPPQQTEKEETQEEYPGLYGPIETKLKRRRTQSAEPPPKPDSTQDTKDGSTKEAHVTDSHTAMDSLLAKKIEGSQMQEPASKDGSLSPRLSRTRAAREKDSEDKSPGSPSATSKKVMPKFELVKLADGLKSQAVELSPRSQRRRERESQEEAKQDGTTSPGSPRDSGRSPGETCVGRASPRGSTSPKESTVSVYQKRDKEKGSFPARTSDISEHASAKDKSSRGRDEISEMSKDKNGENISPRLSSRDAEIKLTTSKDEKSEIQDYTEANSSVDTSPERQWSKKARAVRTFSSEIESSFRSSSREREGRGIGSERERRPSVENLRAAIERRQRSFSSETADSDQELQNNAKKALEVRLSGRISSDRRDSTDSVGSNKQSPLDGRREPVLMRSGQKKDDTSVSSLRRKFVAQEFGSAPNVTELTTLLTGRKEKERPREGCVKQMSQAFTVASMSEQGAGDMRRSSKSSSVRSSPQSLSPASSTSSLSNIVASQIKRLQDKASSSPESPERKTSIQTKSIKDTVPSLYSIHGRLEHRQSLTNVADVRAKFDKRESSESSPVTSRTSSPSDNRRYTRKEPAKPTLVPSVAAARIKYTVSVSNSENSEPQKKSVSLHQNGSIKSQRMVAVMESSEAEKSAKSDSTVTFTINQSQKRRHNMGQGASRFEENNNSNNNNKNFPERSDAHRKGSPANHPEASNRPNEKQEKRETENRGASRKNSFSRNDKHRGSLQRQTESRESSRRGSLTKGKESPKAPARRRSFSKGKESPKNGSRRNSVTKGRDSSNESSVGKTVSKELEPPKEMSSLHVSGSQPDEDERSRRRRRRRERSTPSPEPLRPESKAKTDRSEGMADIGEANNSDARVSKQNNDNSAKQSAKDTANKGEVKVEVGTVRSKAKLENEQHNHAKAKQDVKHEVKSAVKTEVGQSGSSPATPDVKAEVKAEANRANKSEAKSEVKQDCKPEITTEVKPDRAQDRRHRREERARRNKEREEEASKAKEEAARQKAEAARAKLKQEMEAARIKEAEAARLKAEKQTEEAKKAARVERRESKRAERRGKQREKAVAGPGDTKKAASPSDLMPSGSGPSAHSIRRRHSEREEQKLGQVSTTSPRATKGGKEEEDPNMPDLLAQAQKKASAESPVGEENRSPRAILTTSALRGAEAVIGHPLPKPPPPEEEESKEDADDDRRSRKDATRRSRAINRGSRISRLDIFKRARSVDSSKASKDRSPDRLLGGGGASSRACSMDRSGKNRDKSPGGEETRKGGSWLSKRTGSISNFLRPSNCDGELWDELEECYCILQSCASIYRPAYEYEDMCQLRFLRETSILT